MVRSFDRAIANKHSRDLEPRSGTEVLHPENLRTVLTTKRALTCFWSLSPVAPSCGPDFASHLSFWKLSDTREKLFIRSSFTIHTFYPLHQGEVLPTCLPQSRSHLSQNDSNSVRLISRVSRKPYGCTAGSVIASASEHRWRFQQVEEAVGASSMTTSTRTSRKLLDAVSLSSTRFLFTLQQITEAASVAGLDKPTVYSGDPGTWPAVASQVALSVSLERDSHRASPTGACDFVVGFHSLCPPP